jgi:hypothetical protein
LTEHSPTRHATSLQATFQVSWQRLNNALAAHLFRLAGWCAPNAAISARLLWEAAAEAATTSPESSSNDSSADRRSVPPECDKALNRLYALGLARRLPGGPALHLLLAEFARLQAQPGDLEHLAEALIDLSSAALKTDLPAECAPLRPHLQAAAGWAEQAGLEDAGTLWNNLGYYMKTLAEYPLAKAAYARALAMAEKAFGPEHPKVAIRPNNLGACCTPRATWRARAASSAAWPSTRSSCRPATRISRCPRSGCRGLTSLQLMVR